VHVSEGYFTRVRFPIAAMSEKPFAMSFRSRGNIY
jgi:hypothetical protein